MNKLIDIINERFDYKQDGLYVKKKYSNNVVIGQKPGCIDKEGYRKIKIDGKLYSEHRLVWLLHFGNLPNIIDHIDRNKLNNNISNLRDVKNHENCWNKEVKGITKRKNKWAAQICVLGNKKWLGTFDDKESAIKARKEAELKYFGAYAPL